MFKNYLLATIRVLTKEKLYTVINTVGLAIGLATCFLIYSWVQFETSYDRWPDSERTFRVVTEFPGAEEPGMASTFPMVRTRVIPQYPEVEASTRIFDQGFLGSKTRIAVGDRVFTDNKFYYGDSTFFRVFPFKLLQGDPANALKGTNSIVLTRSTATKFFGSEDPVGKVITVGSGREFAVSGVMEDIPPNSHFHFDLLASMLSHPWISSAENNVWSGVVFHTYVRLKKGSSAVALTAKIRDFLDHFPDDPHQFGKTVALRLQPVQDIHLKSNMKFELEGNGSETYVYLFVTVAMLVLLVALINYTNLATARHTQRFREVGVRKVMGASRTQLVFQFVTESVVVTLFAFVLAMLLVELARPLLLSLSGQGYFSRSFLRPGILGAGVGLSLFIGMLTGVFPALGLSSFRPVRLFKANLSTSSRGITIRKALVVSQFSISILLTICTAITYKQVTYLREAKLGYDLEHTLVLNIGFSEIRTRYQLLKSELAAHPSIFGSTAVSQLPTDIQTAENVDVTGSQTLGVNCISVDPDFFRVMGIPVKVGDQLISSTTVSDSMNHFVLNESALKSIGWTDENAVNKTISIRHGNQKPGPVLGVVSDFHYQSLHHAIGPLVLEFNPDDYQYLLVKIKGGNLAETIQFIAAKWSTVSNGIPFDYMFLDQEYENLYKNEMRSGTLFIAFSVIALVVSLLGLFGLSSFTVERRTKEIELRKILGSDNAGILMLISKDFMILLTVAFFLALPAGYYFMTTWLSKFAFKAEIGPGLFLLAGLVNMLMALFTLSYQSVRISRTDPAETLRYE